MSIHAHRPAHPPLRRPLYALLALALGGCTYIPQSMTLKDWATQHSAPAKAAQQEALAPKIERKELLAGVTSTNLLVTFNGSAPDRLLSQQALQGLQAGETLVGIDYRVAKGQLFGLTTHGRLLRIDRETGLTTPIGSPIKMPPGSRFGFDFNPTVDRIRLVTDEEVNLRLHPDTGAIVDGDPKQPGVQYDGALRYDPRDLLTGRPARIVAVGYTYNKDNDKITTNYAIDASAGYLVVMGSLEGVKPEVSPSTGLMQSVGSLLIDRFDDAAFDIADVNNRAYLATNRDQDQATRLYEVDLASGQAKLIGVVGNGLVLKGMAIEP